MSGGQQQTDTGGQQQQQASDWTAGLAADLKDVVAKNGFADPAAVVKAYAGLQPMIGADKIPLPKDGVWDDFAREKLGIPKDGAYKLNRPQLQEGMTWDENFEKAIVPVAHKLGLMPSQLQGLVEAYAAYQGVSHKTAAEALAKSQGEVTARLGEWQKSLKTEWGQAFDQNVAVAGRAVQHLGGEALVALMNMELKDGGLVGDHPDILRAFAKIGGQLGEAVLKTGQGGGQTMTPAQAEAEARKIMASPEYSSKDPKIREAAIAKVNELFGLQYDNTQDVRRVATIPG